MSTPLSLLYFSSYGEVEPTHAALHFVDWCATTACRLSWGALKTHVGYCLASIRAEFICSCRRAKPRRHRASRQLIDVNVWYQLAESLKAALAFPNQGYDWWAPFYRGIHFLMTVSLGRSLLGLSLTAVAVVAASRFIALIKKIKIKKWHSPTHDALTVQTHFLLSVITAGGSGH